MSQERLPLDCIDPPETRHRIEFNEGALQALAASIRSVGLINPITVKKKDDGRYEVVAGHRRWRAMHLNGEAYIDAVIREGNEHQAEKVKFAENCIRENLTPMEEAIALSQMQNDEQLDTFQLARQVSRTPNWVESRLALLEYPEALQQAVHDAIIPLASALELARIDDDAHRSYLMQYAIESGASSSVLKQWRISWEQSVAVNPNAEAPRPEMGDGYGPPTVMIPCEFCRTPIDHMQTVLMRSCKPCHHAMMKANQDIA